MAEFAKYYVEFLALFWENFKTFFVTLGQTIYKALVLDTIAYFQQLGNSIGTFDVLGWICLILISIINIALVVFLVYRLVQLIRRYIVYRSREVEKDKMQEEIAQLKAQAEQLIYEKDQVFALKMGAVGATTDAGNLPVAATDGTGAVVGASRFVKLAALDEKYNQAPNIIHMESEDMISLSEMVDRFVNFAASQLSLYYSKKIIRLYLAGLATSKIIILEGISGTGKTSLPYAMGKFFGNSTSIISVQPSWRDRGELLGYFNEFTKKFNETDFLASLYETTLREDNNFIVLDEMNLARIEYYFADFLSIMEMPDVAEWKIDIIASPEETDPKNIVYGKLLVPQNVWFVGTANNDDSTFSVTDKVYDRAVAIEINEKAEYFDAPMTEQLNCSYSYMDSLFDRAIRDNPISDKTLAVIKDLDNFVQTKFKIAFGNRILKQIKLFLPTYVACGGTELEALDFMIASKILKKFTQLNLPFLTKELSELNSYFDKKFGKGKMPLCTETVKNLSKLV